MTRRKDDTRPLSNQSDGGRKGKERSPWSRGPNAGTRSAGLSYLRYRKAAPTNGK